jgi:TRAP-type C4-dicarboxylate transport system permease small subunit
MSEHGLWRREEERAQRNRGLTGRGMVGCLTFVLSLALAGLVYWWLDRTYDLYAALGLPAEWPGWVVDVVGVAVLVLAIHVTLTVITSLVWRLTGRDKKVDDMMDDLLKQWDEQ